MRTKLFLFILIGIVLAGCLVPVEETPTESPQQATVEGYVVNVFFNSDFHFPPHHRDGDETEKLVIGGAENAAFMDALNKGRAEFAVDGVNYRIAELSEGSYQIIRLIPVAEVLMGEVIPYPESNLEADLLQGAYDKSVAEGSHLLELERVYYISNESKLTLISLNGPSLMATQFYAEPYNPDNGEITATYQFRYALERAKALKEKTFSFLGKSYSFVQVPGGITVLDRDGDLFAELSRYHVVAATGSVEPPLVFKNKVREAVVNGLESFVYSDANGVEIEYIVVASPNGTTWSVRPK